MAALFSLGALLLVLLTGESYSYPAKQAPGFEASKFASAPAHHQTAPAGGSNYHQPSVQREPAAASYSSNFFAGSPSSFLAGSAQPSSFLPGQSQDLAWAVAPQSPFSDEETSGRPKASGYASPLMAPAPHVSPPGFQGGELTHMEDSFEHGNYETETEDDNFPPPPPGVQAFTSEPRPSGHGRGCTRHRHRPYPYYDHRFLISQYPPGTVTHFSSRFEQGRDRWEDTHYIKEYVPLSSPGSKQAETLN